MLSLHSSSDVQTLFAETVRRKRKRLKLSRDALADRSAVPASTIKKFETTGQISLRQFLLLWQSVDRLDGLVELTKEQPKKPTTIEEVLRG